MTTVIQNKWISGHAEDVRTTSINRCEYSHNFDTSVETFRLNPYPDSTADEASVVMNDSRITDVGVTQISGTDYIIGVGYESSVSTAMTFYTKTAPNGTFSKQASATGNSFVNGSLVTYKLLAFAVDDNGAGQYRLIRHNGGSVTTVGTITAPSGNPALCFVHPEDNILYVVIANVISKWDGTTFTSITTILPTNFVASSVTNYGTYLAITMNPTTSSYNAVCYLWGRDTSLNTLQASIDLGKGFVGVCENLNNNLFFIMSPWSALQTTLQNKIVVRGYAGGAVETILSINDNSTTSIGRIFTVKAKKDGRVYFAFGNSDTIYNFGKNDDGEYALTGSRYIINNVQISSTPSSQNVRGISIIGDVIWVGTTNQVGVYTLQRSLINALGESYAYTSTSVWKTTINPNMPEQDRFKEKILNWVRIAYTGAASGTTTVKYIVDAGTLTTIMANTNAVGEQIKDAIAQDGGLPFFTGREFQFQLESSGGSKIKEFAYNYTVVYTEGNQGN